MNLLLLLILSFLFLCFFLVSQGRLFRVERIRSFTILFRSFFLKGIPNNTRCSPRLSFLLNLSLCMPLSPCLPQPFSGWDQKKDTPYCSLYFFSLFPLLPPSSASSSFSLSSLFVFFFLLLSPSISLHFPSFPSSPFTNEPFKWPLYQGHL